MSASGHSRHSRPISGCPLSLRCDPNKRPHLMGAKRQISESCTAATRKRTFLDVRSVPTTDIEAIRSYPQSYDERADPELTTQPPGQRFLVEKNVPAPQGRPFRLLASNNTLSGLS